MSVEYNKLMKRETENNIIASKEREELQDIIESKNFKQLSNFLKEKSNDSYWLIELVNNIFSLDTSLESKTQYFNKLEELDAKIIKYAGETLILKCDEEIFVFKNLSLSFREFKNSDHKQFNYYNKDKYIPILINKLRLLNNKSKIKIGYISEEMLNSKKLRAWIEIIRNNREYVLDFVNNVCMEKEHFNKFYNPEILNELSQEEVIDNELLSILIDDLSVDYDEYLVFSKEFNNEIQKKKGYFFK